jgi:CDP-diglyceride synthetase
VRTDAKLHLTLAPPSNVPAIHNGCCDSGACAAEQEVQLGDLGAGGDPSHAGAIWPRRDRAIIVLLLNSGLRLSEAAALRLDNVEIKEMYHLVITLQIFPLVTLFSTWYAAALAAFTLVVLAYPVLALVEGSAAYRRIAVERKVGEFRSSLILVQLSVTLLLFVFGGLLGSQWRYVAVVAVMAWGWGDAAAALVGQAFGRHRI